MDSNKQPSITKIYEKEREVFLDLIKNELILVSIINKAVKGIPLDETESQVTYACVNYLLAKINIFKYEQQELKK